MSQIEVKPLAREMSVLRTDRLEEFMIVLRFVVV